MNTEYAVTAFLVAVAGFLALAEGIPTLVHWELVVGAVTAGLFASFIEAYRIKVLIEEGAKSTIEYMSVQKPMMVSYGIGTQMVEQAMIGFQKHVTKAMGKSLIAFEKVIELAVRGIAGLCGLALIAGHMLGWEPYFALGLWIILATLAVAGLMKVSGVFSFAFGLVSRSFVPLNSYTRKAKELLSAVATAGCASWLLFAMQWWLIMLALGSNVNVVSVFLIYALVLLFAFAPFSIDGIGWMELAAVLLLPMVGANAAAVFVAVLVWEVVRLVGHSGSIWLLQNRQDLSQFK